jgi:1-phosphofructokinase family hexose kinase
MIATVTLNPSLDEWVRLDTLRLGALNRAVSFTRYPGGKGINVSRVIHELGGRTVALALAGGDDGHILSRLMRGLAIPHEFIEGPGVTRNNYKIVTGRPRRLTEINTPGPPVARGTLRRLRQRLVRLRPTPRCVVLSGSLPPKAASGTYRDWIVALRRRGIPSALDTSGPALREALAAGPWLIKPNRQEAEEVLQRPLSRIEQAVGAAQALRRGGPSVVILSLGRDGALMAAGQPDGVWRGLPPAVRADSPVGAGDSLVGGFLTGWASGLTLVEAFRLGIASGTASALTPGTELCHFADVHRLLPRVTVKRLA